MDDFDDMFADMLSEEEAAAASESEGLDKFHPITGHGDFGDIANEVYELEAETPEDLEPRPYDPKHTAKRICVFDTETDPFAKGRVVKPFTLGFYDGETYVDFWGLDCVDQFFAYLKPRTEAGEEFLIYAHNGGNFDFHFCLDYMDGGQAPLFIGARLTKAIFAGQEFRDSYKIVPVPLATFEKDVFDYTKLEVPVREKFKKEILEYQRHDCESLYKIVTEFHTLFGDKITIGQVSIEKLNATQGYARLSRGQDKQARKFYYGGRNQYFELGIVRPRQGKRLKLYDVNGMYLHAMAAFDHPISKAQTIGRDVTEDTHFLHVECSRNYGAFGRRGDDGGLDFTGGPGRYLVTIHEYLAALELGLVDVKKILYTLDVKTKANFAAFATETNDERQAAKAVKDKARDLLYKLKGNNAYGKFAQDGERYKNYFISRNGELPNDFEEFNANEIEGGWRKDCEVNGNRLYACDNRHAWRSLRNVRIAASITGAARSILLRALASSERPIYCDTDSIVCEEFYGPVHDSAPGHWKLEAEGDEMAIAGKKLYAIFEKGQLESGAMYTRPLKKPNGDEYKASKGVKIAAADIKRAALGAVVEYEQENVTFRFGEDPTFIKRNVKRSEKPPVNFGKPIIRRLPSGTQFARKLGQLDLFTGQVK